MKRPGLRRATFEVGTQRRFNGVALTSVLGPKLLSGGRRSGQEGRVHNVFDLHLDVRRNGARLRDELPISFHRGDQVLSAPSPARGQYLIKGSHSFFGNVLWRVGSLHIE